MTKRCLRTWHIVGLLIWCAMTSQACQETREPLRLQAETILASVVPPEGSESSEIVVWPIGVRSDGLNTGVIDVAVKGPCWPAMDIASSLHDGIRDNASDWIEVERVTPNSTHPIRFDQPHYSRYSGSFGCGWVYAPWEYAVRQGSDVAVLVKTGVPLKFLNYIKAGQQYRVRLKRTPELERRADCDLVTKQKCSLHVDTEWRTFEATPDYIDSVANPVSCNRADVRQVHSGGGATER